MKELEKTKRISIATTLFILIVIMALLAYKRPIHIYAVNTEHTLEKIVSKDYFVSLKEINNPDYVLIDVRSHFEFEKGHLENAVNIHTSEILLDNSKKVFDELKENGKTVVLYASNTNEASPTFLILYQLGYNNVKILNVENSYSNNQLITKSIDVEKSNADIKNFIAESVKKAKKVSKKNVKRPVATVKKAPKKIITVKKKKKAPAEGGC